MPLLPQHEKAASPFAQTRCMLALNLQEVTVSDNNNGLLLVGDCYDPDN